MVVLIVFQFGLALIVVAASIFLALRVRRWSKAWEHESEVLIERCRITLEDQRISAQNIKLTAESVAEQIRLLNERVKRFNKG